MCANPAVSHAPSAGGNSALKTIAGVERDITLAEAYRADEGGDSPGAHLTTGHDSHGDDDAQQIDVDVIAIDQVLAEADEQRPVRLIKCDVEGFELDVFRGAEQTIRTHQPTILFECEQRHQRDGRSMADTFAYLASLGLRGSFFDGEKLLPVDAFDVSAHQPMEADRFWDLPGYCNNFVFEAPT